MTCTSMLLSSCSLLVNRCLTLCFKFIGFNQHACTCVLSETPNFENDKLKQSMLSKVQRLS